MTWYLYWIRKPEHNDPLSEGYIGVTVDPKKRFAAHSVSKENPYVRKAMAKGAVPEILFEFGNEQEAYQKEHDMRPSPRIGYNLCEGGGKPPSQAGTTHDRGLKGKQPTVSCISCRWVGSWHKIKTHTCRKTCAHDGCDNAVTKIRGEYCSKSCSARSNESVKGRQKRVSCLSCGMEVAITKLHTHKCRQTCASEGCDNRVRSYRTKYCSYDCSHANYPKNRASRKVANQ